MKMTKAGLWSLIVILVFMVPLGINVLVGLPQDWLPFPVVGNGESWMSFWASYLCAAATFIMVIYTSWTLKQNSEQLEEIKRQWKEEHRARLVFSIAFEQGLYVLKIANVGMEPAYNIKLKFSDVFIDSLLADATKEIYRRLNEKSFFIEGKGAKYFYISPQYGDASVTFCRTNESFSSEDKNKWIDKFRDVAIEIRGIYCDEYEVDETLKLDDFLIMSLVINDELTNNIEDIRKGVVVKNTYYYPIQKSLDMIAKKLSHGITCKIDNNIE